MVPFICWIAPLLRGEVRSLEPTYVLAWLSSLTIKQTYTLKLFDKKFYRSLPYVLLRYSLEEFRPKQTTKLPQSLNLKLAISKVQEQYLRVASFEQR